MHLRWANIDSNTKVEWRISGPWALTCADIGAEKEDLLEEQKRVEELLAKKHEVQVSKLVSTIEVEGVDEKPNQFQETVLKEFKKIFLKLEEIESLVRGTCETPLESNEV